MVLQRVCSHARRECILTELSRLEKFKTPCFNQPTVCILLDVGTRPSPKSFYHLWKAFDKGADIGGACGEIAVYKGKRWSSLLNPLGEFYVCIPSDFPADTCPPSRGSKFRIQDLQYLGQDHRKCIWILCCATRSLLRIQSETIVDARRFCILTFGLSGERCRMTRMGKALSRATSRARS